jgi:hypothetical protein
MKRKTSLLPTRIYTYGCLPPTGNAELVEEQYKKARVYRNKLIELELERRRAYRAIMEPLPTVAPIAGDVVRLGAELEAVRLELRGASKEARRRVPVNDVAKARIKGIVAALRKARPALRDAKRAARVLPDVAAALEALDAETEGKIKAARTTCGVYWGTYLRVEAAVEQARKSHADPRFGHWDGSGSVGIQIQKPKVLGVQGLFGGSDTRIQIAPLGPQKSKRHTCTTLQFRIGSTDKGAPVWATFPVFWHRPLPPDADIKWAWISRWRQGHRMKYELQIAFESAQVQRSTPVGEGSCGIDIGWRDMGSDELRIGYLKDDQGHTEEIRLPASIKVDLDQLDSLHAIRDRNFNETRAMLLAWIETHEAPVLRELFPALASWHSSQRFMRAIWAWSKQRFAGDEHVYGACAAYAKQEWHLNEMEVNRRERVHRRKLDFYRVTAARIARTYAEVKMEDFDLRAFARKKEIEDKDKESAPAQRHNRHVAGVATFRDYVKHACSTNGAKFVLVDAAYTTRKCAQCDHVNKAVGPQLLFVCANCGAEWDQDDNASKNIKVA